MRVTERRGLYRRTMLMERIGGDDCSQLSELHRECLPDSLVSLLGPAYTTTFYRYVSRSGDERVFVRRDAGRIVGACVLSLSPETLTRRLAFGTPLLMRTFLALFRPSMIRALVLTQRTSAPAALRELLDSLPKVLLIYTAPLARNRGVGSELLADCEQFLASEGHGCYLVQTLDDEANAALRFYARNGFSDCGRCIDQGRPFRTLRKELSAGTSRQCSAFGSSSADIAEASG